MKRSALAWILPVVVALAVLPVLAEAGHTAKQTPPVKMGTSGGSSVDRSSLYCCGGTLGSLVRYDGVLSILSNNHVLARTGLATKGESTIQPGLIDSRCSATGDNVVGTFAGNIVPLGRNVDAAISTANGNVDSSGAILDIGVPCSNVQAPAVGLSVKKSGRTTGTTTGRIQSINTSVTVQYQKGCGTGQKFTQTYTNQIVISGNNFSAGGDSGSLIISNDTYPNPVGLLFAGNSTSTIANPASAVVSAFATGGHTFAFVGSSCPGTNLKERPLGPADAEIEYATKIKDNNEAALFEHPGVIGVGVGMSDDDPMQAVVVVYVESGHRMRPQGMPTDVEGIPVKVVPTEPFVAF